MKEKAASLLPPLFPPSVEAFLRVHPKVQYDGAEGEADMLLRNFLFPLLLGKELRIAPRDTAAVDRPGSIDCYLCIASPGCCLANQQNLLTCTLLPLKAAMMTILPLIEDDVCQR